jgi:hypothetical protein
MELKTGDKVLKHSQEEFSFPKKRAGRYTARLKHLELCRGSFRQQKILTVYLLHRQKTILNVK